MPSPRIADSSRAPPSTRVSRSLFIKSSSCVSLRQREVKIKGRERRIGYSTDHLPNELWADCMEAFNGQPENDDLAESICANFRPHLFVAWGQPYSLDFEDMFDSDDEMDEQNEENDDGEEAPKRSLPANAWQLRDAFLRITPEPRQILNFLNRWGRWKTNNYVRLEDFVDLQKIVRNALASSTPEEWFKWHDELDLWWDRKTEFPYFSFETFDCEPAIRMTVTIDLLRQVKFRICARADCVQPFSITSAHKRKYCTQYCGHLESLRRRRKKSNTARPRPGRRASA